MGKLVGGAMVTIADASRANFASLISECTAIVLRSLTSSSLTDKRIHRLPRQYTLARRGRIRRADGVARRAGGHTGFLLACEVQSFRITGRAQFPIGTVPGYMHMKYGYTEFVFGGWTDSENQLSD